MNYIKTQKFIDEVKSRLSSGREDLNYEMTAEEFRTYPFIISEYDVDIGCIYLFSSPSMRSGLVDIMHFRVYNQNNGWGSKLLRILCDLADKYKVTLFILPAVDNNPSAIPLEKLKDWYRGFGFVGEITMERKPKL